MNPVLPLLLVLAAGSVCCGRAPGADYRDFNAPPHDYFTRQPNDRLTRLRGELEAGGIGAEASDELGVLTALLDRLGIPVSSQMLVFSTTSLQLSRITPSNPRALYFNEELYLGFIPGGRIEVLALDPDLGAVFHIFDLPRAGAPTRVERATRCMNCHAGEDTGHVPGLMIQSVVPGVSGGSLDAFRRGRTGHGIPLEERFGGWYVTREGGWTRHWGNAQGRFVEGELVRIPNRPEERVVWNRYPRRSSDLLNQLLHEHQAGFINRAVEALYRTRAMQVADGVSPTPDQARELDEQASRLVRYLLFAEEVPLPPGGVSGDPEFMADFQRNRREVDGASLKDFELHTRLFRHRCSYMIYSTAFTGLPPVMKQRVLRRLARALDGKDEAPEGAHLPADERAVVRSILARTLPGFPPAN